MRQRPDYGIDSPAIIAGELLLGGVALALGVLLLVLSAPHPFGIPLWAVCLAAGGYFWLSAGGMVLYSKLGKLYIRRRLLDVLPWRGDESVLDVGCGRGLLLVGVAQRLTTGKAIGVDVWARGAISGNRPGAALQNVKLEGVADRVELKDGDARHLPFEDNVFDVVVSNFVLHEMDTRADREQMLHEIARVLKPGGHVALVDFVFTREAVRVLRACGMNYAQRVPIDSLYFWLSSIISLGFVRLYRVTGSKIAEVPASA